MDKIGKLRPQCAVVRRELRVQPHQFPWFKHLLGWCRAGNWKKRVGTFHELFSLFPQIILDLLFIFFTYQHPSFHEKKIVKLSWMEFSNTVHFMNIDTSKYSAQVWSRLNAPNMGAVAAADLDPVEAAAVWAWEAAAVAVPDLTTEAWEVLPLAEASAPEDPEWEVQAAKWKVSKDWLS